MTIGLVRADWLEDATDPAVPRPLFEGVVFERPWNGFACWLATRAVIEQIDALHAAHQDSQHLPRFTFDGDTLIFSTPDLPDEHIAPFELDDDGDHLWDISLGMVWQALRPFPPYGPDQGERFTVFMMDGTVKDWTVDERTFEEAARDTVRLTATPVPMPVDLDRDQHTRHVNEESPSDSVRRFVQDVFDGDASAAMRQIAHQYGVGLAYQDRTDFAAAVRPQADEPTLSDEEWEAIAPHTDWLELHIDADTLASYREQTLASAGFVFDTESSAWCLAPASPHTPGVQAPVTPPAHVPEVGL